jgi:hypothetical protein
MIARRQHELARSAMHGVVMSALLAFASSSAIAAELTACPANSAVLPESGGYVAGTAVRCGCIAGFQASTDSKRCVQIHAAPSSPTAGAGSRPTDHDPPSGCGSRLFGSAVNCPSAADLQEKPSSHPVDGAFKQLGSAAESGTTAVTAGNDATAKYDSDCQLGIQGCVPVAAGPRIAAPTKPPAAAMKPPTATTKIEDDPNYQRWMKDKAAANISLANATQRSEALKMQADAEPDWQKRQLIEKELGNVKHAVTVANSTIASADENVERLKMTTHSIKPRTGQSVPSPVLPPATPAH